MLPVDQFKFPQKRFIFFSIDLLAFMFMPKVELLVFLESLMPINAHYLNWRRKKKQKKTKQKEKKHSSLNQEKSNWRDLTVLFAEWHIHPLIIHTQWKWTLQQLEITLASSISQRIWWCECSRFSSLLKGNLLYSGIVLFHLEIFSLSCSTMRHESIMKHDINMDILKLI